MGRRKYERGFRERIRLAGELATLREGSSRVYEVTLIRAGETLHGWIFPSPVLASSLPLWQGVTSLADHRSGDKHPSVRDIVGITTSFCAWVWVRATIQSWRGSH